MKKDAIPLNAILWMIALTLGWGTSWPILKIALNEIPPWTFRGLIGPFSAGAVFLIAYLMKEPLLPPKGQWRLLLIASALNITGWHIFSAMGIRLLGSGHASIIAYTMPLWAVTFAMLFAGERPTPTRLAGLALGLTGMAILLSGQFGILAVAPLGAAFMLMSAISWGAGTVVQKNVAWRASTMSLTAWQLLIGGLPISAVALVIEVPHLQPVSAVAVWATVYSLAVPMILCWFAWFRIVNLVPVSVSSVSTLMIPVVGVISGAVVLGEAIGWREAGALVLVCMALALVLTPSRARKTAKT
jgi:drug/metabolite transporter (DMT)-like permease